MSEKYNKIGENIYNTRCNEEHCMCGFKKRNNLKQIRILICSNTSLKLMKKDMKPNMGFWLRPKREIHAPPHLGP